MVIYFILFVSKLNLTLIGYNGCYEVNTFGINRSDIFSWTKAMEAIVSHYEEDEKKRRMPRI
jgi:hypothetical protein